MSGDQNSGDTGWSESFEIVPASYDEKELNLDGFEQIDEFSSPGSSKQVPGLRLDNHSGFRFGIGCAFSGFFSGVHYFREDVGIPWWKKKKLRKKHDKLTEDPFRYDFYSRLWLTYRRYFPKLGSKFISDCGWGCMLRTAQMMMGHALISFHLGREWRWNFTITVPALESLHRGIVSLFGDTEDCVFSIHNLVSFGRKIGKEPGDWFGPTSAAYVLRDALNMASNSHDILKSIRIYVAQDMAVVPSEVERLLQNEDGSRNTVIVMIPALLGLERFNQSYVPCLKQILAMECTIGIIGGRPNHSLYFTGWQDDSLIYFDPHFCQPAVDVHTPDFPLESFHCRIPKKMPFRRIDPSMCLGFRFNSFNEFQGFKELVERVVNITDSQGRISPMFYFTEDPSSSQEVQNMRSLSLDLSDSDISGFELLPFSS
ncbi:cysteine protease ATG4D-like isoform X2 [Artemia franciscana]|uniref:cysteine protease ATG4D-like isoform X2 n=1 Tax=Artemia franciscana TaxID=6661 RepID=UPI0032DAE2C0